MSQLQTKGIENEAVTDAKLSQTGVAAGTYDPYSLSVNARGRITGIVQRSVFDRISFFDHFLSGAVGSNLGWVSTVNGTNATIVSTNRGVDTTNRFLGVLGLDTGTTTTGRASLSRTTNAFIFGFARVRQLWRVRLPTVPTVAQDFETVLGFSDNTGAGTDGNNGIYFKIDRTFSASFWICTTSNGGTRTNTVTTIPISTSPQQFEIDVAADASSAVFKVNGAVVATINTNIPTGVTGVMAKVIKTAGNTARQLDLDAYAEHIEWS